MKESLTIKRVVQAIYESDSLRGIERSHRQVLLTRDGSDNIAAHEGVTAKIGVHLATLEKANPFVVAIMVLFHDDPETRTGDQNWVHKRYVASNETQIRQEQFSGLPNEDVLLQITQEYDERITLESKVAKDADLLHQIVLLRCYAQSGNIEAKRWLQDQGQLKRIATNNGKLIAKELYRQSPNSWWKNLATSERIKLIKG